MEKHDDPITSLTVGDIMNSRPLCVDKTTNVLIVADMMSKMDSEVVLVVDNNKVIGIVTEKDLLNKVLAKGKNPEEIKIEEIMSSPVISIDPKENILNAMIKMIKNKIRRLVVMDGEKILGIVTVSDILRITPSMIDVIQEKLRANFSSSKSNFESLGYCDKCGSFSDNLQLVDGLYICESCRED
jgi:signal-transduction protein with cAMP-binding, CBS, and nucleotidyltransferase domain